jgi:hypothetical protein
MAYNPYFPQSYQPYPQYQPYMQQAQTQGITWIQGKNAALSYPLGAGQSAILMDSDAPYVYKKETAPDGRPLPMEVYRLVKEDDKQEKGDPMKDYIKADQIDEIITEKVEDIVRDEVERRLSEFSFKPTRKSSKNTED